MLLDCLRGLDILRDHPLVDARRIGVAGASQGGGLALAVGALRPQLHAVAAEVPFLCDIVRSATVVETDPLAEWRRWCAAHPREVTQAAQTLAYVDVANFVVDIDCPTFLAYSPADRICPVAGLRTVLARLRCPLTAQRYRPGHNAPLLRHYRRRAEAWLVRRLLVSRGGNEVGSPDAQLL
jgi:cephalosporin-C deacetylase